MRIGSYQKSSHIDFPGKVAAVIYTQGCCWRCPFCHNRSLVYPTRFQPAIPIGDIFDHLRLQRSQLNGVVLTGGEPTLQSGLSDLLRSIREMGYAIKLDTNGNSPSVISSLLEEKLVDYIAMDIKGPLGDYTRFAGCEVDTGPLELSIELIKQSGLPYEFRTTLVGGLHTREHINDLAPLMYGVRRYAVQTYRMPPSDFRSRPPFSPPDQDLVHAIGVALRENVDEFVVR